MELRIIQRTFGNLLRLLLVTAGVLAPLGLRADSLALNPTGPLSSYNGSGEIDGFAFMASSAMDVTALGIFAGPSLSLPVGQSFAVGLWTDSGILLSSALVTSADPSQNSFYFHPITPISLSIGQNYVVGAQMASVLTYYGGSYTTADGIDYLENRWVSSSNLVMPGNSDGPSGDPGYLGGNVLVTPSVPEPAATGLTVLGLLAMLAAFRFRTATRRLRANGESAAV